METAEEEKKIRRNSGVNQQDLETLWGINHEALGLDAWIDANAINWDQGYRKNQFQRKDNEFSFVFCGFFLWVQFWLFNLVCLWVAWGDVSSDSNKYRQELGVEE